MQFCARLVVHFSGRGTNDWAALFETRTSLYAYTGKYAYNARRSRASTPTAAAYSELGYVSDPPLDNRTSSYPACSLHCGARMCNINFLRAHKRILCVQFIIIKIDAIK